MVALPGIAPVLRLVVISPVKTIVCRGGESWKADRPEDSVFLRSLVQNSTCGGIQLQPARTSVNLVPLSKHRQFMAVRENALLLTPGLASGLPGKLSLALILLTLIISIVIVRGASG